MHRSVPLAVMFMLIALQSAGKAQDQNELRASLQGCINDAITGGNFDKAYMGRRGILVVRCLNEPARKLYTVLTHVPERNTTSRNGDKVTERNFGQSMCSTVRQKANGSPAAEFVCRIAISVGDVTLQLF
jgi:hypothetical protein